MVVSYFFLVLSILSHWLNELFDQNKLVYAIVTHAIKGNVDIMIALVMHTGAAVGAQIGVVLTRFFRGPRIRLAFSPLPLVGAGLIVYGLLTGHPMK